MPRVLAAVALAALAAACGGSAGHNDADATSPEAPDADSDASPDQSSDDRGARDQAPDDAASDSADDEADGDDADAQDDSPPSLDIAEVGLDALLGDTPPEPPPAWCPAGSPAAPCRPAETRPTGWVDGTAIAERFVDDGFILLQDVTYHGLSDLVSMLLWTHVPLAGREETAMVRENSADAQADWNGDGLGVVVPTSDDHHAVGAFVLADASGTLLDDNPWDNDGCWLVWLGRGYLCLRFPSDDPSLLAFMGLDPAGRFVGLRTTDLGGIALTGTTSLPELGFVYLPRGEELPWFRVSDALGGALGTPVALPDVPPPGPMACLVPALAATPTGWAVAYLSPVGPVTRDTTDGPANLLRAELRVRFLDPAGVPTGEPIILDVLETYPEESPTCRTPLGAAASGDDVLVAWRHLQLLEDTTTDPPRIQLAASFRARAATPDGRLGEVVEWGLVERARDLGRPTIRVHRAGPAVLLLAPDAYPPGGDGPSESLTWAGCCE